MTKFRLHIFLSFVLFVFVTGCNITRGVKEGEYLLDKNTVTIDKKHAGIQSPDFNQDDLYELVQQQTNDKLLGVFKLGVWVNSLTSKGKETRFKTWLDKTLGQDPVILNELMIGRSTDQMELFLNNHGYFHSDISTQVNTNDKKATVKYNVVLAQPYMVRNAEFRISDTALLRLVTDDSLNSLIKPGDIYSAEDLDEERLRISSLLRNEGYYYFAPEFVFFEIDSSFNSYSLNIYTNIQQYKNTVNEGASRGTIVNHQKYYLNRIAIDPDFNPIRTDTSQMQVYSTKRDTSSGHSFNIFYRDKLKIRPRTLRRSVFMEPGRLYREKDERYTYRQLSGFPLFAYTALDFRAAPDVIDPNDSTKKYVDCLIELSRKPVQSFTIETEGTTSGSKLGLAGNFVYRNLNLFRGGEVLSLRLTGGVEWQASSTSSEPVLLFFNTVQTGAEASLDFPKFLIPFFSHRIPKTLRPRTTIKTGVNYQNRPDYERYITNGSFGYRWAASEFVNHVLTPLEINSVSIFPDSAFVSRLEELNDQRLLNQYTDHFIMSANYTYIFNNQQLNQVKNFTFFRWNIESAGNALSAFSQLANAPKNEDDYYGVWNIPFSQYLRTDIDFRYYWALRKDYTLVYRNLVGVGVPYGNSDVLPFEKGFYAGGSNSMRGWNYRTLGPGSFVDTLAENFERMGDLTIQANFEYRFPIYKWFQGALFTDIGNIWLLNESENYDGGQFQVNNFISELGIDAGFGLRLDLSFFIFRIDAATPIRDPSYPLDQRWQFDKLQLRKMVWNFGIGYPF